MSRHLALLIRTETYERLRLFAESIGVPMMDAADFLVREIEERDGMHALILDEASHTIERHGARTIQRVGRWI